MENGQDASGIWQVPYVPSTPGAGQLPVELLSFAELRAMDSAGRRRRPQRPAFHVLAMIDAGRGRHRADFVARPLAPRTVVHLRPGVVHQWTDVERIEGSLVLFTSEAVDVGPSAPGAASSTRVLDKVKWELLQLALQHLRGEYADARQVRAPELLPPLKHTLAALVLRADNDLDVERVAPAHRIFRLYQSAVEKNFHRLRHVNDYAEAIGYNPRTLSRATAAATGVNAKQYLDERVTLEAKRLLAHTDITVAQLATALGFSQPANFTAFFTAHAGQAPSQWRDAERRGGPNAQGSSRNRPSRA